MAKLRSIAVLFGCWMLLSTPAHAYLDPGTGSALIQGMIAAVAAISVTLKLYWHRIIAFLGFGRATGKKGDARESEQEQASQELPD